MNCAKDNDTSGYKNNLQKTIVEITNMLKFDHNIIASEQDQNWTNEIENFILNQTNGVLLMKKLQPLIPLIIKRKRMQDPCKLVVIEPGFENEMELISNYFICFKTFIESPYVSFKTANTHSLGNIQIRDYFVLQYLALATCKRIRQDACLQLGIAGISSIGKTVIFESPILSSAHLFTAQQGVGRYVTDNKSIFLLNDIDIEKFICSADGDMFKLICRTEPASAKVFGSVNTVEPIHVLYTTNGRLFSHNFARVLPATNQTGSPHGQGVYGLGRNFLSSLQQVTAKNIKTKEEIFAFQNRFLECFCHSAPPFDYKIDDKLVNNLSKLFPKCTTFQKIHLVIGTFDYVLDILAKYKLSDFFSQALPTYCCSYLFEYINYYSTVYPEKSLDTREKLFSIANNLMSSDVVLKLKNKI